MCLWRNIGWCYEKTYVIINSKKYFSLKKNKNNIVTISKDYIHNNERYRVDNNEEYKLIDVFSEFRYKNYSIGELNQFFGKFCNLDF